MLIAARQLLNSRFGHLLEDSAKGIIALYERLPNLWLVVPVALLLLLVVVEGLVFYLVLAGVIR